MSAEAHVVPLGEPEPHGVGGDYVEVIVLERGFMGLAQLSRFQGCYLHYFQLLAEKVS